MSTVGTSGGSGEFKGMSPSAALPDDRAASPPRRITETQINLRLALVALGLAAGVVAVVVLAPKGPPHLNPNMTFRTLPIVEGTSITYPGMSQDGEWVAYPAADGRGTWDLYFMNVNGGSARKVTSDSSVAISYVDVSPDGSRIVYCAYPSPMMDRLEVRVVSSHGGPNTLIAHDGNAARFSRDGRRVGYIVAPRYTASDHEELWSVGVDGKNIRREYVDSLGAQGRISFSWSPDAKSFAWIRSYPEGYQELFVISRGGVKEHQLTTDRKNIDEVFWTQQNNIVFSSNRGGNTNLWVVRASGGPPTQLTKGPGPDIGMRVSDDGKTLLYLQQQPVNRLWTVALDGTPPKPVTLQEERLGTPVLSADGQKIAIPLIDPDPIKLISHLVIMNRDGSDRRQLTSGDEVVFEPKWGPTGRRLAYLTRAATEPADSTRVFFVDEPGSSVPRPVATAQGFVWIDASTIMAIRKGVSYRVSVTNGAIEPASQDSITRISWPDRDYQLIEDGRAESQGLSLVRHGAGGQPETLKVISKTNPGLMSPDGRLISRYRSGGDIVLVDLPSLQERRLHNGPGPLALWGSGSMSWDRREMVFTDLRLISKLVLIENLR